MHRGLYYCYWHSLRGVERWPGEIRGPARADGQQHLRRRVAVAATAAALHFRWEHLSRLVGSFYSLTYAACGCDDGGFKGSTSPFGITD